MYEVVSVFNSQRVIPMTSSDCALLMIDMYMIRTLSFVTCRSFYPGVLLIPNGTSRRLLSSR